MDATTPMHTPPEPTPGAGLPWPQRIGRLAVAVLAIALSARVATTLPGSSVPQSAQTLAVLLVGAFLGARDGSIALVAYLLLGGAGVPVFADGASGWAHLVGPTAGYLLAFALTAGLVGWLADLGRLRGLLPALAAMLGGHALILGLGWIRLALTLGGAEAFQAGVAPFIAGGVAKSALAAAVLIGAQRTRFLAQTAAGRHGGDS